MITKHWWKEGVVYQIYPKSFFDSDGDGIGDIKGIVSKLDYIKDLGVDIIWLSPINKSPDRDNGYDISDYRQIQPAYGTMADYETLIAETHSRGMKILMDLVVNHTSNEHEWYKKGAEDENSPCRGYYYWRKGEGGGTPNNWNAYFGGSAWTYSKKTDSYSLGVFSPYQPDINWHNPALRREIYDIMRFWLDKGVDGFRLDAIACIGKQESLPSSADKQPVVKDACVHTFLKEMNKEVLSHYDVMTVGEASGLSEEDLLKFAGEDSGELNMMIQFSHVEMDLNENYKWNLKKIDLVKLKKLFDNLQCGLDGKAWNALYWSNHDQPRVVSRLGDEGKYRELSAKMIATNTHLMQGTPYVYQGEELGMTNSVWKDVSELNDLESVNAYEEYVSSGRATKQEMLSYIGYKGRDNARTPMQWTSDVNGGFTSGKPWLKVNNNYEQINAKEQKGRLNSVYEYYKQLIKLRHENEIVVYGEYESVDIDNPSVFAYKRKYKDEEWIVVCNFTAKDVSFDYAKHLKADKPFTVICNYGDDNYLSAKTLRPYEAVVIKDGKDCNGCRK